MDPSRERLDDFTLLRATARDADELHTSASHRAGG
jgi:hypothetical protein